MKYVAEVEYVDTDPTTVSAHLLLGLNNHHATNAVDIHVEDGSGVKITSVAAGEKWAPNHPVRTNQSGQFHVTGTTPDCTVLVSR